ncbi:hypothetical protein M9H77_06722 [Catharanthus roseus]|uniref:Uncharacterized protein n=1 Tax=Catharanthus roseus TaxID=4058 RepID=A0ACC0BSW4_CATRO|nr:hypothetical protein M9H77_06722 [Catharanthus roseus]
MTTMASSISTAVLLPRGLMRNSPQNNPIRTVNLSPFSNKASLNFSFTRSISGFGPIVFNRVPTVASPSENNSRPLTVFSAKGYKMKTHKASAKRFRVSGSGKIMRRRAGKQHLLRKKNAKRRLRLSKLVQVDRSDYNNVIGALPYLKVNRQAN